VTDTDALWTQAGVATTGLGLVVAVAGTGLLGVRVLAGLVVLVGLVGAGAGAALARRERTPDPHEGPSAAATTVPGDDVARTLDAGGDRSGRETLRELILTALRAAGADEATARRRLRDGSWTDDPAAGAFLRGRSPGLADRLRARLAGTTAERRRADRAADAVARLFDVDVDVGDDDGDVTDGAGRATAGTVTGRSGTPRPGTGRADGDETVDGSDGTGDRDRPTGRWTGVLVPVLAAVALGVLTGQPAVVLAAVVPVGVAAYARLDRTPDPDVTVTRTVSRTEAAVGDRIEVTVTVENVGEATLPELVVRDGTPPGLAVLEGTPELVTALGPGRTARIRYAVEAARGRHEFAPAAVAVRGAAGAHERTRRVPATDGTDAPAPDVVTCVPALPTGERARTPPLAAPGATTPGPGQSVVTGGGVEFAGVREYRHGDPYARIDWRRYARTGDRFTVEYVEDRLATVLVVIDARRAAYCRTADGVLAIDECVRAAADACAGLLGAGNRVGLAAASPRACRVDPGAGTVHARRLERALATAPALERRPPGEPLDPTGAASGLADRLEAADAVVFVSPLADDGAVTLARTLDALAPGASVLGVDPTGTDTPWRRVARAARSDRLDRLRRAGLPVADDWHRRVDRSGGTGPGGDRSEHGAGPDVGPSERGRVDDPGRTDGPESVDGAGTSPSTERAAATAPSARTGDDARTHGGRR
jgi:uncharacterized repeat protein (TIGR01451 family)